MRDAFKKTPLSRVAAFLALASLRRMQKKIDPRQVNGGVFLGLGGAVVKSHGSADVASFANAIDVAVAEVENKVPERISDNIEKLLASN